MNNQNYNDDEFNKLNYRDKEKERKKLILGSLGNKIQDLEIFKMKFNENIELFINWDYWKTGEPKRENYKIAELKEGKPINIKTDGKRDFSMTGRRKRTFIERNYIIEYKGVFEEVEVIKEDKNFIKMLPENVKEINLMKHLR